MLAYRLQYCIKRITHNNQVGFNARYLKLVLHLKSVNELVTLIDYEHINRKIMSIGAEKAFSKIQHTFIIKTQQTRSRGKLPQLDKEHLQKAKASITFNDN